MSGPAKSLGEKLFEALVVARAETTTWFALSDQDRATCERAGLAFAASLSHDETAGATIQDLRRQVATLASEAAVLRNEATTRMRADAAYRSRWKRDPQMVVVDEIRRHLAGLRPHWAEALAEMQARVFGAEDKEGLLDGAEPRLWMIDYALQSGQSTWSAFSDEAAAQRELAAPKGPDLLHRHLVRLFASCTSHPDRLAITNLDGEDLCRECANAWVKAEGDHQAYLEQEAGS